MCVCVCVCVCVLDIIIFIMKVFTSYHHELSRTAPTPIPSDVLKYTLFLSHAHTHVLDDFFLGTTPAQRPDSPEYHDQEGRDQFPANKMSLHAEQQQKTEPEEGPEREMR